MDARVKMGGDVERLWETDEKKRMSFKSPCSSVCGLEIHKLKGQVTQR